MQKTKLGISVPAVGALAFFLAFFSGYLSILLLTVYVLLFEENGWLKKTVVKALTLMLFFSFVTALVGFIPNIFELLNNFLDIFGDTYFYPTFINDIVCFVNMLISVIEKVLFIVLGLKAFNQGSIPIDPVDNLINKYMDF